MIHYTEQGNNDTVPFGAVHSEIQETKAFPKHTMWYCLHLLGRHENIGIHPAPWIPNHRAGHRNPQIARELGRVKATSSWLIPCYWCSITEALGQKDQISW